MRAIRGAALGALLAAGAAGCDEAVAPGAGGSSEVRVGVRGDEPAPGGAARPSASRSAGSRGRIEVAARVYLWSEGRGWEELTRGAASQTVEASGSDGVRALASARVEADSYHRVRVEFEQVEATIAASADIDGPLLSGSLRVDGGSDGMVTVERELRVEARSGASAELEIDLNADHWWDGSAAGARTVGEAEFREALRIVVR